MKLSQETCYIWMKLFGGEKSAVTLVFPRHFLSKYKNTKEDDYDLRATSGRGDSMDIQIVSGFLGAGKTTFLNKYLPLLDGNTVVIENEFGEVGLDGDLIQGDIPVKELYAGCICCSLAIDFRRGIKEIVEWYQPDRIVIEPSGVGRLSDIVTACARAKVKEKIDLRITKLIAIVDLPSYEEYKDGFGAFYQDQIQHARLLLLSNLDQISPEEKKRLVNELKTDNPKAIIYEDDWRFMDGEALLELVNLAEDYEDAPEEVSVPALPADRVFASIAISDPAELTEQRLEEILDHLGDQQYGQILRAKGILSAGESGLMHFDYTPAARKIHTIAESGKQEREEGAWECKVIIIGCDLNDVALRSLFQ
ncbi:CobW family GTP-binding protein [Bariatricus sp. SGI.154]|uniref:CobW family GTP-binding protein n=1 Tax=Bariatricus sp. SGI.154 TaxID=3420549 RepID=UPI003CFFD0ED